MKYLPLLLLLFVACSSSTDSDTKKPGFEPYRVGTWMVVAPDSARWQGADAKAKSSTDTTVIKDVDGRSLTITDDSTTIDRNFFLLTFIDSSRNENNTQDTGPNIQFENIKYTQYGSYTISLNEDRMKSEITLGYNCDFSGRQLEYIMYFSLPDSSTGEPQFMHEYHVEGMKEVVHDLKCN